MPTDPVYPNQYWTPVKPDDSGSQWASRSQRSIPYRGHEQHGVPHVVDETYEPHDEDLTKEKPYNTEGEIVVEPIPVIVVGRPTPLATQRKFITSQTTLPQNQPVLIAAKRQEMNRWTIQASTGALVFFGNSAEQVQLQGFPVPTGQALEVNTNQPIYAYATSAAAIVYVFGEYEITVGQERL